MPGNRSRGIKYIHHSTCLLLFAFLLSSCLPIQEFSNSFAASPTKPKATVIEISRAEITFQVTVPEETNAQVYLDLVDEVAGIAWNPLRLSMQKTDQHTYSLTVPIKTGSNIKYRYSLDADPPIVEHSSRGTPIRYRLIHVSDPTIISDTITSWGVLSDSSEFGRITGIITEDQAGKPISDVLIAIAGLQTFSAADGSFVLENIPVGTHQLAAYSTSGQYKTFQQGAKIATGATTRADFSMSSTRFVDITFIVKPPANHPEESSVRIVGNIYPFGNTFASLKGGVSTIASRAPTMHIREDGLYILTTSLPAGSDLRYTYSLGDGFWNSELTPEGRFRIRQLIVPEQDMTIEDEIIHWGTDQSKVFSFQLTVPENTPAGDTVSIQFAPFGWTEPIPMWPVGKDLWAYQLYSPYQIGENLEYRYCRNEQCDKTYEKITSNQKDSRSLRETSITEITDQVESWMNWSTTDQPTAIAAVEIKTRQQPFIMGVEFTPEYAPSWQTYFDNAYKYIGSIGGKQVVLSPTWTYTLNEPPVLEMSPGNDMLAADLEQAIFEAKQNKLEIILYPHVRFSQPQWWDTAAKDEDWWNKWFENYSRYLLHFAEIAENSGVSSLIIGEPDSEPSWPKTVAADESKRSAPPYAQDQWSSLIENIRMKFSGPLLWAVNYPKGLAIEPALLSQVDAVYVICEVPVSDSSTPAQGDMAKTFTNIFDKKIFPFHENINKPIWIGLTYPSIDGAARGCVKQNEKCIPVKQFFDIPSNSSDSYLDLQEQADIYSAALIAINQEVWIEGVISRGFYPPASLKDNSYSIHGKPASDVLWYWFPRLSGTLQ